MCCKRHTCVSQAKLTGNIPTLECIDFIATQINVQQTTQIMSQAKLVGARYNLMCCARGFLHILNVASQTPLNLIPVTVTR